MREKERGREGGREGGEATSSYDDASSFLHRISNVVCLLPRYGKEAKLSL